MFNFLFGSSSSPPASYTTDTPITTKATKANKLFAENISNPSDSEYIDTYTKADIVFSCVGYASDIVSQVTFKLQKKVGNKYVPFKDKKVLKWFEQPNPFQSLSDILYTYTQSYLLTGNAYLTFEKVGINYEGWVLDPTKIVIVPDEKKFLSGYLYGETYTYKPSEIIHFKNSVIGNQYYGESFLKPLIDPLLLESYATSDIIDFYKNSLIAQGIFSSEFPLTEKQIKNIRAQFRDLYSRGSSERHGHIILPNNMKYQPMRINPKDGLLLESLGVSSDRIYKVFRLNPALLGISTNDVNGTELREMKKIYINNFIRPMIYRLSKNLEIFFKRVLKTDNLYIIPDYSNIPEVNTALEEKIESVEKAVTSALMTRNEGRIELGKEPIDNELMNALIAPAYLVGSDPIDLTTGQRVTEFSPSG